MRSKVPLRRLQIALLLLLTFSAPRLAAAGAPLLLAEVVLPSETAAGFSRPFAISDDGRFVLLASTAPNLIAGQAEGKNADDLFLRDRASGEVLLVSHRQGQPLHTADESASAVAMSPDGQWVLFTSRASNLVAGSERERYSEDVFLWQRATGLVTLVSHLPGQPLAAAGRSRAVALASDGSRVLFDSDATDLVAGAHDGNGATDVFLFTRSTGEITLLSAAIPGGDADLETGNGASKGVALLDNGEVFFNSTAANLVAGDTNNARDVLVWQAGTLSRPLGSTGFDTAARVVAAEGRFLLVEIDSDHLALYDRLDEILHELPATGKGYSPRAVALSANGQRVLFDQDAKAWLWDLPSSQLRLVSRDDLDPESLDQGAGSALSSDGRWAVLERGHSGRGPDIVLYDFDTDSQQVLSHDPNGQPADQGGDFAQMSRHGQFLAFASRGSLLASRADRNLNFDAFFLERGLPDLELLSPAALSSDLRTTLGDPSTAVAESVSGDIVLFTASAALLGNSANPADRAAFAFDPASRQRRLLAPLPGQPQVPAPGRSAAIALARDGQALVQSDSAELVPNFVSGASAFQLYLYSPQTLSYRLVTEKAGMPSHGADSGWAETLTDSELSRVALVSSGGGLVAGNFPPNATQVLLCSTSGLGCELITRSVLPPYDGADRICSNLMAASGFSSLTFGSYAGNLSSGTSGTKPNVYLWNPGQALRLISRSALTPATEANGSSQPGGISANGRYLLVSSTATDLMPSLLDGNGGQDLFLYDTATSTWELVSRSALFPGATANAPSIPFGLSTDGRFVLFASAANDLVPGQISPPPSPIFWSSINLFRFDRKSGETRLVTHLPGQQLAAAGGAPWGLLSRDGSRALVLSYADNLVPGVFDRDSEFGVYYWDSADDQAILLGHHYADPLASIRLYPNLPLNRLFSGSQVLVSTFFGDEPSANDTNGLPDAYLLLTPSLFRDGFEAGDTSAWQ